MSDILEEKTVEVVERNHKFYCDMCNGYLGESVEYDDGFYDKKGRFEKSFCLDDIRYTVKRNLCPICRVKFIGKIRTALMDLGFKPENI